MMTRPDMESIVGTVLEGTYRITRLIEEGGMGAVYEAVQLRLDKRVAVKLMARELAANREALVRFHREAQIASHLGHPHLVTVIDFGTTRSGEPYIVMEYLDGEDLEHRLRRVGRLPIEAAVHITRQVASALHAAHNSGIVHRDLKPGNIFLTQIRDEPDFAKVLDFGISKMKTARTQLTSASTIMGTPNYMSPEQVGGLVEEIDHRSDQWALGCIAWEMLLGRCPFVADDPSALFYQILNLEPLPLAPRVPDLPPDVEPILRRALSKKPSDRFPSIRNFSQQLEAAALGQFADETPAPILIENPTTPVRRAEPRNLPLTPLPTPRPSHPSATIGYNETRTISQAMQVQEPEANASPIADDLDDVEVPISAPPWRRIRPIHAVVAAACLLLLLAALLLLRSKSARDPIQKISPPTTSSTIVVPPRSPSTTPEIVLTPSLPDKPVRTESAGERHPRRSNRSLGPKKNPF